MKMNIVQQTRKTLSSYGGVGSIIETIAGSLLIENFDKWCLFKQKIDELHKEEYQIRDSRLLKRLQYEKGFPNLESFIRIPEENSTLNSKNYENSISAKYFPEWFYCEKCKKFRHLKVWFDIWKDVYKGNNPRENFFEEPKCGFCYQNGIKLKEKKFYQLEQVRFILTSPYGDLQDIPWDKWPTVEKGAKSESESEDDVGGGMRINFDSPCCEKPDLLYQKGRHSDLSAIWIKCGHCNKKNTLSGLFGLRLPVFKDDKIVEGVFMKPVIRTSTSVYYPILVNSVLIPAEEEISPSDQEKIKRFVSKGKGIDFIYEALEEKYSMEKIEEFISHQKNIEFESESEYRLKEYNFFLDPKRVKYPNQKEENDDLVFEKQTIRELSKFSISDLILAKKIKMTTVQTAYTRQEPVDKDDFLHGDCETGKVRPQYTSKFGKNSFYLPAIESYGEGIFIKLDPEIIEIWIDQNLDNDAFNERIDRVYKNIKEIPILKKRFLGSEKYLIKFLLLHTLSHLIVKELEFYSGYPATSLHERLYIDQDNMSGFLIYTIAGSEGSYGGLLSQGKEENLINIIESALERAKDCASDPVCYYSENEGVNGVNIAACYSCALLPEITCEEFNCLLDRGVLIDEEFGFFNNKAVPKT